MNRIILAYCHQNAELAETVEQQLSRIGIPFEPISDRPGETPGSFSSRLAGAEDPVVLFITDNLLKSRDCMEGTLAAIQLLQRRQRVLAVVADGRISKDGGLTYEAVETHFDRMVYALQYMNYWQTAWLELSSRHQHAEGEAREKLETELNATRNIANEIGELISLLREKGYTTWDHFKANDYALFFREFGLQEWHEQYRQLVVMDYGREALPPLTQAAPHQVALAEMPTVTGPLIPEPAEVGEDDWLPEKAMAPENLFDLSDVDFSEEPAGNGHSHSPAEPANEPLAEATPQADPSAPGLDAAGEDPFSLPEEEDAAPEDTEAEIDQAIRDAWFWLEKGHTERGLELLLFTLDQYPDNERLKQEARTALDKYGPQTEELPVEEQVTGDRDQPPATDHQSPEPGEEAAAGEARSYNLMGDMAAEKGDYLFAKYCWDRTVEFDPGYPGIYRKLGQMTSEHLRDYRETAVHYLKKAVEQEPDDASLYLALASAVLQNEDPAQAQVHYEQAIRLDPSLRTPDHDRLFRPFLVEMPAETAETVVDETTPETEEQAVAAAQPQPLPEKREVLTVLITGATSGIGRATAEIFARHGHRVILTGRRVERLAGLRTEFEEAYHADVLMLPFDVREQGAVQAALDNLPESWQNIDVLVNNAGLAKGLAPIHEGDLGHWDTMIDTNIKGLLYVTRAVTPGMVRRRRGHIINIGSSAGKEVYKNGNVYCATKFAVDALTRAMRLDLVEHNIRVSQVSPGHVEETEFAITRFDGDAERARIYDDFQPLKAGDVADAIYYQVTRPPHVNVQDIVLFSAQQASATVVERSGR